MELSLIKIKPQQAQHANKPLDEPQWETAILQAPAFSIRQDCQ